MKKTWRAIKIAALVSSLLANIILTTGVLYLRVPAVRATLSPIVHALLPLKVQDSTLERVLEPGQLHLVPAADKNTVVVHLPEPPEGNYYVASFDTGATRRVRGDEFVWTIHGTHFNDSNLLKLSLYREHQETTVAVGEVEILRRTEADLRERFSFHMPDGNLVIGRCTFELVSVNPTWPITTQWSFEVLGHLTEAGRTELCEIFPQLALESAVTHTTSESVINACIAVLQVLHATLPGLAKTGPSDVLGGVTSPVQLALSLRRGQGTIQCSQTRDLFAAVAVAAKQLVIGNIRKVDAFRYDPIPGIVVNGHSLLEVRAHKGKWFVFDPFVGAYFTDTAGQLLSADNLRTMRVNGELNQISAISVGVPNGVFARSGFEDVDHANYNYWSHFRLLRYTHLGLP